MNKDYLVMMLKCIVMVCLLVKFIPKDKIREANVAFFFMQGLSWLQGLIVAEISLIEYPVRCFPHATKTSFPFEYFVFPSICAIFNVRYPKEKSSFGKCMYYFYYCSAITILEMFVEKYMNILKYMHWNWYVTWITVFISLYISRRYYEWFFNVKQNKNSVT